MSDALLERLRAAFDGEDVPRKNIALRQAHDEIVRLKRLTGVWLNATADASLQRDELRKAISTAIEHIDRHMGDTDPSDPEHPLLLAMQALTGTLPDNHHEPADDLDGGRMSR